MTKSRKRRKRQKAKREKTTKQSSNIPANILRLDINEAKKIKNIKKAKYIS